MFPFSSTENVEMSAGERNRNTFYFDPTRPNPTQPIPTHGWTQSMAISAASGHLAITSWVTSRTNK